MSILTVSVALALIAGIAGVLRLFRFADQRGAE